MYGGGDVGLMGVIANAVLEKDGHVIGVIPEALKEKELEHMHLSELRIVDSMHTRKAQMADLADGFIAMPGGFGTMEELFEVITWSQLGFHGKPCALLNVCGYYDRLIDFLRHMMEEKFVKQIHYDRLIVEEDISVLLDRMAQYQASPVDKWMDRKAR